MSKSRRVSPLTGKLVTKDGKIYAIHGEISPGYLDAHISTYGDGEISPQRRREIVSVSSLVGGTIRAVDPKVFTVLSGDSQ